MIIKSSSLIESLHHYIKNHVGVCQKVQYETNQGVIVYYADELTPFDGKHLFIYYIQVKSELRKRGISKDFLSEIQKSGIVKVTAMTIINSAVDSYLEKLSWEKDCFHRYIEMV